MEWILAGRTSRRKRYYTRTRLDPRRDLGVFFRFLRGQGFSWVRVICGVVKRNINTAGLVFLKALGCKTEKRRAEGPRMRSLRVLNSFFMGREK